MKFIGFEKHKEDQEKLERCLRDILIRIFDQRGAFPKTKREKVLAHIYETGEIYRGGKHCTPGVQAYTYPDSGKIHICPGTFGELQGRLCAVLFHELIHATGQGEFDAEVFENLIYPPSVAASGNNQGGTWPYNDCEDFCTDTTLRADGLRETAHFIWNPSTGEVWRRKADGSKDGNPLWTDAEILKKWQCRCPDTKKERRPGAPLIDRFEPGDRSFSEPREEEQPPVGDDELKEIRRLLEEIRRRIQELERRISEREGKPGAPGEGYPHEGEPGAGEGQPGYPHEGGQEGGGHLFIDRSEPGDVANP